MDKYHQIFCEGQYYHIYNRGNNKENIFFQERNYEYFLSKYEMYLSSLIKTYAYCLLPNHFHLLIKVEDKDTIYQKDDIFDLSEIISEQFRKFFISYSMSINKQEGRSGSLFIKNFKRKHVNRNLERLVFYIHYNPVHHQLTNRFDNYRWSSYTKILNNISNRKEYKELLDWFGGKKEFEKYHVESQQGEWERELEFDI